MKMEKRYRMVPMPEHLQREYDQILAEEFAGIAPDAEMTSKEYYRRCASAIATKGSDELRAWCKNRNEAIEDNRRRGVELC